MHFLVTYYELNYDETRNPRTKIDQKQAITEAADGITAMDNVSHHVQVRMDMLNNVKNGIETYGVVFAEPVEKI